MTFFDALLLDFMCYLSFLFVGALDPSVMRKKKLPVMTQAVFALSGLTNPVVLASRYSRAVNCSLSILRRN
jgi:hypothetical protein